MGNRCHTMKALYGRPLAEPQTNETGSYALFAAVTKTVRQHGPKGVPLCQCCGTKERRSTSFSASRDLKLPGDNSVASSRCRGANGRCGELEFHINKNYKNNNCCNSKQTRKNNNNNTNKNKQNSTAQLIQALSKCVMSKKGPSTRSVRVMQTRPPGAPRQRTARKLIGPRRTHSSREGMIANPGATAQIHANHLDVIGLKQPSKMLLNALTAPFEAEFTKVKIPFGHDHTQTIPLRRPLTFKTNASGYGFVCTTPNISGQSAVFFSSGTGSSPAGVRRIAGASAEINALPLNKPYTPAMFGTNSLGLHDYKFRLVANAVRVFQTSPLTSRSGSAYILKSPTDLDICNLDPTDYDTRFETVVKLELAFATKIQAEWYPKELANFQMTDDTRTRYPGCPSQLRYFDPGSGATNTALGGPSSIGIAIISTPNTSFDAEILEVWEVSGPALGQMATPVTPDVQGLTHVSNILHLSDIAHAQEPHVSKAMHNIEAVEKVAIALEPAITLGASAVFGPEAAPVVAGAFHVLKQVEAPLNHLVESAIGDIRSLFSPHHKHHRH